MRGDWVSLPVLGIVTSLFLHADWRHLLGNMLYLWIFANNVEDRLGRPAFIAFYLVGGVAAVAGQVAVDPTSDGAMIGASGAISAVLGAYLVLFPGARIQSLVYLGLFYQLIAVPAVLVLGFWFALHLFDAIGWSAPAARPGVAFFAHVAGFVAGVLLALPLRLRRRPCRAGGQRTGDGRARPALATAWDNPAMDGDRGTEIEMIVESVRVHMRTGRHVLSCARSAPGASSGLGRAVGGEAIAMRLQGLTPERPLTHDLFATA